MADGFAEEFQKYEDNKNNEFQRIHELEEAKRKRYREHMATIEARRRIPLPSKIFLWAFFGTFCFFFFLLVCSYLPGEARDFSNNMLKVIFRF